MSGIGNFVLVDSDELEAGNVTRHVADLRYVGRNKAAAVADLIANRNPRRKLKHAPGLDRRPLGLPRRCGHPGRGG